MALTFLNISETKGYAALLPNQPIIQGCKTTTDLVIGDVVTLVKGYDHVVVAKAAPTDLPFGVIVGNAVKGKFIAGESVSVFPAGSFVYLEGENIHTGDLVGVNGDGELVAVTEAGKGVIGVAWTEPKDGLFVLQVAPKIYEQGLAEKQNNLNLGAGLEFVDTDMFAWEGEIPGEEILYTKVEEPEATGNVVYYLENGKYEVFVDDATFANNILTITLASTDYEYVRSSDNDRQDAFLNVVTE